MHSQRSKDLLQVADMLALSVSIWVNLFLGGEVNCTTSQSHHRIAPDMAEGWD